MNDRVTVVGHAAGEPIDFTSNAAPQRPSPTRNAPLRPNDRERRGMPLIIAQPSSVAFPFSTTLKTSTAPLLLKNIGTGPLSIERLSLEGSPWFAVRAFGPKKWLVNASSPALDLDPPMVIAPGQAWTLVVQVKPQSYAPGEAALIVRTNDPSREKSMKVALRVNVQDACLQLDPAQILEFAEVNVGSCRTKVVDARNCGGTPVVIEDAGLVSAPKNTPFSVAWGAGSAGMDWIDSQLAGPTGAAVVVPPKGKKPIAVTYCPSQLNAAGGPDQAVLGVVSSAAKPLQVNLKGLAVMPTCPKAAAGIAQVEAAQVGTMLQLTSHDSKATSGQIAKWQWTLQAPPSSIAKLMPSAQAAAPSLVVDVAGSYTFCLDVWDSAGKKSCDVSCLTVHATETATYQAGNYGAGPVW